MLYFCCTAPPAPVPVDDCTANADCENNANGLTVCDVGNTDKCIGKFNIKQPYQSFQMLSIV